MATHTVHTAEDDSDQTPVASTCSPSDVGGASRYVDTGEVQSQSPDSFISDNIATNPDGTNDGNRHSSGSRNLSVVRSQEPPDATHRTSDMFRFSNALHYPGGFGLGLNFRPALMMTPSPIGKVVDDLAVAVDKMTVSDDISSKQTDTSAQECSDGNLESCAKTDDSSVRSRDMPRSLEPCGGVSDPGNLDTPNIFAAQSEFVSHFDLRITDYFTHARCFCSYVLYSVHFNDFGIAKVATRRYSHFTHYDTVIRDLGYHPPVSLPEESFWDSNSPSFLSQRFQDLKGYLRHQLRQPTTSQLSLLHMFLGCSPETILYLRLVTANTNATKLSAVSTLFRYLMRSGADRVSFISREAKIPLAPFQDLPAASHVGVDAVPDDYRLCSPLVVGSLLDCLLFGDAKSVYEVCAIMLWMLHRNEALRASILSLKVICHVTKALSRLIVGQGLPDLEVSINNLRDRTFLRILASLPLERNIAWNMVSYYLLMSINLLPESARSFLDNSSIQKFITLLDHNECGVFRRLSLWALWIGMFEEDLRSSVDRDTLGLLLKKLYGSEESTLKVLCGLVLTSLIVRGWFSGDEEPRASVLVVNLLPHVHNVDCFVRQEIFCHTSLRRFGNLLSDTSLSSGARLFLVSVLRHHLLSGFEDRRDLPPIFDLCDMDVYSNVSELSHVLFGAIDPDYRDDITTEDMSFGEKFSSLYSHHFSNIADTVAVSLDDIVELFSLNCDGGISDSNAEVSKDSWQLCKAAAVCLLYLPYRSAEVGDSDYFNVAFHPQSVTSQYNNVVHLKGGSAKLELESTKHTNLADTVVLRLDKQFFVRRVAVLRALLSGLRESISEFDSIHLSGNEVANGCMGMLRKFWCCKDVIEHDSDRGVTLSFDAHRNEHFDPFNNFAFEGYGCPMLDVYDFRSVDAVELCSYASEMAQYSLVQQGLLRVVKFAISYHQACSSRLATYRSMVGCLERRIDDICVDTLDDLSELESRFLDISRSYAMGLQEEGDLISALQENNTMLSRVQNMLRSSRMKLDACHRDVVATQKRLDDLPNIRSENLATQQKLTLAGEKLLDSIRTANEQILELQDEVARDERDKREVSQSIQRLTYLLSVLEEGKYHAVMSAFQSVSIDDITPELRDSFDSMLSAYTACELLDEDTVHRLKGVIVQQLNVLQDHLNAIYGRDANLKIAALNRQVAKDEESLYQTQLELNNTRKSCVIDSSVLEETLGTQKMLMETLKGTISNLTRELRKINAGNLQVGKQLAEVKSRNDTSRTLLDCTRLEFKSDIMRQRDLRLRLFHHLLAAELLCKKMWQEHQKLSVALSCKTSLINLLCSRRSTERSARLSVIEVLNRASKRMSQTAAFLCDCETEECFST
ncbi:uncharacterized protein BXIN_0970 [Babesia sp. Xinjiang]|uniref:uncharacterized protein n=1 Tax=Babesia sp. Xinjiang TaxID=462227 RepID=UPI000A266218|nr:uncharacterized protein BXIN_0970 [Babesia sp. Xinjiang]ORM42195.1 hypothetical protein BXIN_0970 [Babesia sp. Xinjiang]